MNSNHPTLYFKNEEETKWSLHRKYDHVKKEAQTVISMTHESMVNLHAFTLVFKIDMFSKNYFHPMGSNPHLLKDMQIYT